MCCPSVNSRGAQRPRVSTKHDNVGLVNLGCRRARKRIMHEVVQPALTTLIRALRVAITAVIAARLSPGRELDRVGRAGRAGKEGRGRRDGDGGRHCDDVGCNVGGWGVDVSRVGKPGVLGAEAGLRGVLVWCCCRSAQACAVNCQSGRELWNRSMRVRNDEADEKKDSNNNPRCPRHPFVQVHEWKNWFALTNPS